MGLGGWGVFPDLEWEGGSRKSNGCWCSQCQGQTFAACLKLSNRAEFVHFFPFYFHMLPLPFNLQWLLLPHQKHRRRGLLAFCLGLTILPRLHSPWPFTQADLKKYLVVNSRYTSTLPTPVFGNTLAMLMECAFFQTLSLFFFLASLWFSWMPPGNATHCICFLSNVNPLGVTVLV